MVVDKDADAGWNFAVVVEIVLPTEEIEAGENEIRCKNLGDCEVFKRNIIYCYFFPFPFFVCY